MAIKSKIFVIKSVERTPDAPAHPAQTLTSGPGASPAVTDVIIFAKDGILQTINADGTIQSIGGPITVTDLTTTGDSIIGDAAGDSHTISGNLAVSGNATQYIQGLLVQIVTPSFTVNGSEVQVSGANLEAAGDVARVSTLVSGHILGFNGTNWVNTTP